MKESKSRVPHLWPSRRITDTYLAFFEQHSHLRIDGGLLAMPESTTSFIIAGMQPLMPYLAGKQAPLAPRLTGLQRCLRTDDVEMVGRNTRKMSAFQMLGNWSIGEYGRREAIEMTVQLLGVLGIDQQSLWITTFGGDELLGLPPDEETMVEWLRIGMPRERLVPLAADDNFWTTGGAGPCGCDTELFVDRGVALGCGKPTCRPGCDCERFLEIWNLVFIEYEQRQDGSITALPLRSVDTGMGVERIAMVLQHTSSVFEIDLLAPALQRLDELTPVPARSSRTERVQRQQSRRMIIDHMRAALFLGVEGVVPARDGRGSVLRRLLRRAATRGHLLGVTGPFLGELLGPLARAHGGLLTDTEQRCTPDLVEMVSLEEQLFAETLRAGLRLLNRTVLDEQGMVPGEWLFQLHAERGFPADLAAEVLSERGIQIEWPSFDRANLAHRRVSRASSERRSQQE